MIRFIICRWWSPHFLFEVRNIAEKSIAVWLPLVNVDTANTDAVGLLRMYMCAMRNKKHKKENSKKNKTKRRIAY